VEGKNIEENKGQYEIAGEKVGLGVQVGLRGLREAVKARFSLLLLPLPLLYLHD